MSAQSTCSWKQPFDMQFLDLYFRLASVTLLLVQVALILRDAWDVRPARFGALLAISLVDVVGTDGMGEIAIPIALEFPLSALSMNSAIFIWWFSLSLFDDDFRLGRLEWGVAALWFAFGIPNFMDFLHNTPLSAPWAAYVRSAMAIAIVGHIVYRALAGRRIDLIEQRRRVRALFAFAISGLFLLDLWSEFAFGFHSEPLWFSTIEHGAFFVVITWSILWLLKFDKAVLTFDRPEIHTAPSNPVLSGREKLTYDKLLAVMETEKAYLEPELSIGMLAERVETPEHQLRALINKTMEFRNFRSFLNSYRMETAKSALADPSKAALPILTIAMDSGFASLSSFNRAFRQSTGQTPSEFRAAIETDSADQI